MSKSIAIVTGSSSGFGLLISLELAKEGFHVIATMRNTTKKEMLLKKATELQVDHLITTQELDVTSEASITNFSHCLETLNQVDLLINNAGYAYGGFVEEISLEEYRKQFETNFFGVISITQLVLPYMRKQGTGKIINISSISGIVGFPGLSPYVSSKYALEGWSESLRLEMKPFGINVALVEPGSYKTNIWTTGKTVSPNSLSCHSPYYAYMEKINHHLEAGEQKLGDPREVATQVIFIAKKNTPSLRYPIGKGISLMILIKKLLPWKWWEQIILKQLK